MTLQTSRAPLAALLSFAVLASLLAPAADAYDPRHPKVQAIVERAVAYLESHEPAPNDLWQSTMGYRMMVAYAIHKHRHDPRKPGAKRHPKVQYAIQLAHEQLSANQLSEKRIYEIGVAISFLTELGDDDSLRLAGALFEKMMEEQKPYGGWDYDNAGGDTSLMQYAMLGMWSARHSPMQVQLEPSRLRAAANWLLRTQAPAGNWAYRGKDPGSFTRIAQDRQPSLAMFAAGAGSLYLAADLLGLRKQRKPAQDSPFIPSKPDAGRPPAAGVDEQRVWESLALADRYWDDRFAAAAGRLEARRWQFYYLYALERYMTFRKAVRQLDEPATGPNWYNAGVEYLERVQRRDGSFASAENNSGPMIDTSLAVLFLLRSTEAKLPKIASGIATGGPGIPENFQFAELTAEGQVLVPEPLTNHDIDSIIKILDSKLGAGETIPDVGKHRITPKLKKSQLEFLREKVAKEPDHRKRMATVRLLSGGGLENAPLLIFALSDPDPLVATAARDSLRLIARKSKGFGLPERASREQVAAAQRQWSDWLRRLRPDLEF